LHEAFYLVAISGAGLQILEIENLKETQMIIDERFDSLVKRAIVLTKKAKESGGSMIDINASIVMCKILDLLIDNENRLMVELATGKTKPKRSI
jgi:hypothetical protein